MASLFDPITLRGTTIRNRVWLAPMCQYSVDAQDGVPTDWHLVHLGARATGGFGLVLTEATAVAPEGRISPRDTGIWNDEQVAAWRRVTDFVRAQGATAGIQLAHAGRKASTYPLLPGFSRGSLPADDASAWPTLGPSELPYEDYLPPQAMSVDEIHRVAGDFAQAARRSVEAGFEVLEIHAAHGYLLHQFLSPLSNHRTDEYGGALEGRARALLEVVAAVREAVPDVALLVRVSATDWLPDGWQPQECVELARMLATAGVDLVDVSSGGNAHADIPLSPGYQVPFARQIKEGAGVPTAAVGLVTEPAHAARIVAEGDADAVLLGRQALLEPGWPQRAAAELGVAVADTPYPGQYARAGWPVAGD